MQPERHKENDYITLNGGHDKSPRPRQKRATPSKAQIAAWGREIVSERQREAAKDIAEKTAEFDYAMAEMEAAEERAEIDYAASIIKPKLELQKIRRMIETVPELHRAKALLDWAGSREEGALKQAAYRGFFALAGNDADKVLSIPKQEAALLQMDEDNRTRRESHVQRGEQIQRAHQRLIQHLEILRTDNAMRAYDRELLEKRIRHYEDHGDAARMPSFDSIIAMAPPLDHSQDSARRFGVKQ